MRYLRVLIVRDFLRLQPFLQDFDLTLPDSSTTQLRGRKRETRGRERPLGRPPNAALEGGRASQGCWEARLRADRSGELPVALAGLDPGSEPSVDWDAGRASGEARDADGGSDSDSDL